MSLICIGMVDSILECDALSIQERQNEIASKNGIGVFFSINWEEPIVSHFDHNYLFSLTDSKLIDNCERLLLPDEWEYNYSRNDIPFRIRAEFIRQMIEPLTALNYKVNLFLGTSGDEIEDYISITVSETDFGQILANTWGRNGESNSYHYLIVPNARKLCSSQR